jgi:50S ribosomal subunit-associated GTPase HflX
VFDYTQFKGNITNNCQHIFLTGKTTLVKALTGEKDMQPSDTLFATLDVTAHEGMLPSRLKVIYIDTVGFMSDLPVQLLQCFLATLEDVLLAVSIVKAGCHNILYIIAFR